MSTNPVPMEYARHLLENPEFIKDFIKYHLKDNHESASVLNPDGVNEWLQVLPLKDRIVLRNKLVSDPNDDPLSETEKGRYGLTYIGRQLEQPNDSEDLAIFFTSLTNFMMNTDAGAALREMAINAVKHHDTTSLDIAVSTTSTTETDDVKTEKVEIHVPSVSEDDPNITLHIERDQQSSSSSESDDDSTEEEIIKIPISEALQAPPPSQARRMAVKNRDRLPKKAPIQSGVLTLENIKRIAKIAISRGKSPSDFLPKSALDQLNSVGKLTLSQIKKAADIARSRGESPSVFLSDSAIERLAKFEQNTHPASWKLTRDHVMSGENDVNGQRLHPSHVRAKAQLQMQRKISHGDILNALGDSNKSFRENLLAVSELFWGAFNLAGSYKEYANNLSVNINFNKELAQLVEDSLMKQK